MWLNVTAGDPQGFALGPLSFLIYINDLPNEIASSLTIFADDSIRNLRMGNFY